MRVCLVFGAGASLAQAAHFVRGGASARRHPPLDTTFFEKVKALNLRLSPALRRYIRDLTAEEPGLDLLSKRRMEEFFKDAYFDFRDRPRDRGVRTAYTDLVELYNTVLRETTNWLCDDGHQRGPVGRLIAAAARYADDELSIITFNHDLVIENEIYKRARLRTRWCIDAGYGGFSDSLQRLYAGGPGFEFPEHSSACRHDLQPIRILKLHGSLNWIVRVQGRQPTAKDLAGEGRLRDLFLDPERKIEQVLFRLRGRGRERRTWYTWPVIVPPVYAKQALIERLRVAWEDARSSLTRADRVLFFGYSLPEIDIEAEKLFQRSLSANRKLSMIEVVNPAPAAATRYAGIAPNHPMRWYSSAGQFLSLDGFASD